MGAQVFDLAVHDAAQQFDISDSIATVDLPQLSFSQAADLGHEARRDIMQGAFGKRSAAWNPDESDDDGFGFGLDQVGQEGTHDASQEVPAELQGVRRIKRRVVGKTSAADTVGLLLVPQVT